MELDKALFELTKSSVFKKWNKENPYYFLAHGFLLLDEQNKDTWQIGFYNKEKDRMVTFFVKEQQVKKTEEQEILKSKVEIKKLNIEEVKLTTEKALQIAKDVMKDNYSKEPVIKMFFIIQNTDLGVIYNVTFLLQNFKTFNVKISAADGKVLRHSCEKLADFS